MKLKLWVATIGALLAVPVSTLAQQSPRAPDPADPRVAVPPARYESAMTRVSPPEPEQGDARPDKAWRTANDTVSGAPGHAGHAAPVAAAKPVVQPVADHGKHHSKHD